MMTKPPASAGTVLVVDDDVDTAELLRAALLKRGFDARCVTSGHAALDQLGRVMADIVVTDLHMEAMSGIELAETIRRRYPDVLTIVITGALGLEPVVAAIRAGAYDYVIKPVKLDALTLAVERGLDHLALKRELIRLRAAAAKTRPPDAIVGSSPAIRGTLDMVARVATSDATVLITGESGTGKELVARALHRQSGRGDQPFVAINCAAMPAPLLESELFGHVQGAFTDAKTSRPGLFLQAGRGTVFLDEIGEMPMEMQVKLLRVLQERRVRPVGGDEEAVVEARVVTATNRDLERQVAAKLFREDLFYRINVVQIHVPALRARAEDVLFLAHYFLSRLATEMNKGVVGISASAARKLLAYDWPGNVRELENCMERAVALCQLTEITLDDLPPKLTRTSAHSLVIDTAVPGDLLTLEELGTRYTRQVLAASDGNKSAAARILGIDRRSLYRRMETLGPDLLGAASDCTTDAASDPGGGDGSDDAG